jgi:RimJ/RimL family protein N-acetyltransferase
MSLRLKEGINGKSTLETPPWNIRTRAFYTKLGFRLVKETDEDLYFERTLS